MVRLLFLDPAERDMYPDWEQAARDSVAWLRGATPHDLDHPRLGELVGDLAVKSQDFARLWGRHDVRTKASGVKRLVHPVVGEVRLGYETFSVNGRPGQSLTVYHPENSRDADALAVLASHVATTALSHRDGTPEGVVVVDTRPTIGSGPY